MKLKWYGHACFRLAAEDGTAVITDPYTPETSGYKPIEETADVVITSSSTDSFHCRADLIPGSPIVIDALNLARNGGHAIAKGIPIAAIETFEMFDHPEHPPEANSIYRFTVDGIHIGHMGDLGNPFTSEQIEFFQNVDILLALAGGSPVIELEDLKTAIDQIRPKLVVPMHFRTLVWKLRTMHWIEAFLSYFPDEQVDFASAAEVQLSRESLAPSTRILVLDYA